MMRRFTKSMLALFLCLTMTVTSLPISVSAMERTKEAKQSGVMELSSGTDREDSRKLSRAARKLAMKELPSVAELPMITSGTEPETIEVEPDEVEATDIQLPDLEVTADPIKGIQIKEVTIEAKTPVMSNRAATVYTTVEAAGEALREGLVKREPLISIPIVVDEIKEDTGNIALDVFYEAMMHTGIPNEGDYLLHQYCGGDINFSSVERYGNQYILHTDYTLEFFTNAQQEKEMDEAVAALMEELDLEEGNDYEKVKGFYDWICNNITYDYANLENNAYLLKHSAYAALVNRTAVCQGYALLVYRLALEYGIDCHYVSGEGNGGGHGWNIIQLGDYYYNLDATWDAGSGGRYDYFLRCDANFDDHEREDPYNSADYYEVYPMDSKDYQVDETDPVIDLTSYELSSKNPKLFEELNISVRVTDNNRIEYVTLWYLSPDGSREKTIDLEYDEESGTYVSSVRIDGKWDPGEWMIEGIYAEDSMGNYEYIANTSLYPDEEGQDLSFANILVVYDDELLEELEAIKPLYGVYVYMEDAYIYDETIDGDVYIGPDAFVEMANVKVNGKIYVLGAVDLIDVTANEILATAVTEPNPYYYYQGEAYCYGNCNFKAIHEVENPVTLVPYHIDFAISVDGILSIRGNTADIADFYINDQPVELIGGKIVSDEIFVGDSKGVVLKWITVFGQEITAWVTVEKATAISAPVTELNASCISGNIYYALANWDKTVTAISSNEKVAIVTEDERIVIKGVGTTTIKITGKKDSYEVKLTVSHTWDDDYKIYKNPTCTETGERAQVCNICGSYSESETIPALGHDFNKEWTLDSAGTCQTVGTESRHCTRKGCNVVTDKREVPKGPHNYSKSGTTKKGAFVYSILSCTYCGDSREEIEQGVRIAGSNRFDTSIQSAEAMKECMGIDKFDTVVLASGLNFADALSGSYLAAVKNAPIILVNTFELAKFQNYILENVKQGGTIYVLGGASAVSENAIEAFKESFKVVRLGGDNRFETNLLVLKEAGVEGKDLLVCTGLNFADSLSASASGQPLLLVMGNSLMASQKEFMNGFTGKKYIIGGIGAVSEGIERQIGTCTRLAGNNRFVTSVLIAKTFFDNPKAAVFASAMNFPDGLCGGPVAYQLEAPLILTAQNWETEAKNYVKDMEIGLGVALGGESALSNAAIKNILGTKLENYK